MAEKKSTIICTQEQFDMFFSIHRRLIGMILLHRADKTNCNEFEQTRLVEDIKGFWGDITRIAKYFNIQLQIYINIYTNQHKCIKS